MIIELKYGGFGPLFFQGRDCVLLHCKQVKLSLFANAMELIARRGKMDGIGQNQRGFTLVEMVTIMVIVGILAAVAIPRLQNNDFASRAAADQVRAVLRYAQKVAIATHPLPGAPVAVTIRNAALGEDPVCVTALVAGAVSCVLPSDVLLSGTLAPAFDAMGRPVPNLPTPVTVGGITINIEAETGYVR